MTSVEGGVEDRLNFWKNTMALSDFNILMEQIDPEQIDDEEGIMNELIGVSLIDPHTRTAILYHTGDATRLTDEDIVHKLVHLRRPEWSDPIDHYLVVSETSLWLEQKGSRRFGNFSMN